MKRNRTVNAATRPTNPEIACTREGVGFWITESQLDTVFEALEEARDLQYGQMDGNVSTSITDEKAEDMFVLCDKFARFHRVLIDLRERRGE